MALLKILLIIFFIYALTQRVTGQRCVKDTVEVEVEVENDLKVSTFIIPSLFIGYGFLAKESSNLKLMDFKIKEKLNENFSDELIIDDFMQYSPSAAVYLLNLSGIKGKHNYRDASVILATATLLMTTTVRELKSVTHVVRPDNSSDNSFPSGHTATAFMGAEFLWQEYKDVSVWYGISGYAVAATTGFFRMYNNRHWLTDVITGAGIGMMSTKIACWVNPFLTRQFFTKKRASLTSMFTPGYDGKQFRMSCSLMF